MRAGSAYQAVLFDLFGTLVPRPTAELRRVRRIRLAGLLGCDAERFVRAYAQLREQRLSGSLGSSRHVLAAVAEASGGRPGAAVVERAAAQLRNWARADTTLPTDAVSLLAALRATGWRLGLVSDCETETAEVLIAAQFDAVTLSCRTGTRKPAVSQYEHCAGRLGVALRHCVYVGDGGSNELHGAAMAGALPIHLCRDELNPSKGAGFWPSRHHAISFKELTALLAAIEGKDTSAKED